MNPEAMLGTALGQCPQENHLTVHLLDPDMVVPDMGEASRHLVQFMIVRGKKHLCRTLRNIMEIFGNSPSNRNAIVGAGSPANLVQQDQGTIGQVIQYIGRLVHLHHKGTLARSQVIRSSDTSKNLVHQTDSSRFSRNETPNLSHQYNQRGLPQDRRLTGHIRSSNHHNPASFLLKTYIVRYVFLPGLDMPFNNRMPPLNNLQIVAIHQLGTHVSILRCHLGK